ncbi:MAG TPA: hypothetical protein VF179_29920 [Thermoanaerobaculia bacterium]|nr:hypothetical protein [Thermoanaerobaculia bacterium]
MASLVLGFPIAFLGIWSFVCAILAIVSGYRSLAEFRIERAVADEGEELPTPWYAMIGWGSYRGGILTLRSSHDGLTLRIPRIFPFHPPIRVPWDRIREDGGRSILLDGRVRLRVPEETLTAIRQAQARHAG